MFLVMATKCVAAVQQLSGDGRPTRSEIDQLYDQLQKDGGPKDPEDYRNLSPKQPTKEMTQEELDAVKEFIRKSELMGNPPKPGGPS